MFYSRRYDVERFGDLTKEHMALSEAIRQYPQLQKACLGYMSQAPLIIVTPSVDWRSDVKSIADFHVSAHSWGIAKEMGRGHS